MSKIGNSPTNAAPKKVAPANTSTVANGLAVVDEPVWAEILGVEKQLGISNLNNTVVEQAKRLEKQMGILSPMDDLMKGIAERTRALEPMRGFINDNSAIFDLASKIAKQQRAMADYIDPLSGLLKDFEKRHGRLEVLQSQALTFSNIEKRYGYIDGHTGSKFSAVESLAKLQPAFDFAQSPAFKIGKDLQDRYGTMAGLNDSIGSAMKDLQKQHAIFDLVESQALMIARDMDKSYGAIAAFQSPMFDLMKNLKKQNGYIDFSKGWLGSELDDWHKKNGLISDLQDPLASMAQAWQQQPELFGGDSVSGYFSELSELHNSGQELINAFSTEIVIAPQLMSYCSLLNIIEMGICDLERDIKLTERVLSATREEVADSVRLLMKAVKRRFQTCVRKHDYLTNVPAKSVYSESPESAWYFHELWQLPDQLQKLAAILDSVWTDQF